MNDTSKVKACFAATHAYPLFKKGVSSVYGGAEIQMHLLSTSIAADPAFDVSMITGDFGQPDVEEREGVKLYKSFKPVNGTGLASRFREAVAYYRLLGRVDADVYITTAKSNTIFITSLYCRRHGKKHIHRTAHEREVDPSQSMKGIITPLFRSALRRADVVLTQNEGHRDMLRENHGVDAVVFKNVFVIPREPSPVADRKHVLWVARCAPWKRPEAFIGLAERFPDETFIMIAPPSSGQAAYREEIARRASGQGNLHFMEHVPFDEIQDYFDQAKVFVNTSEREGFPNTFIQAGLGATPILSLSVDPDGFIGQRNCGRSCGNAFEALAEELEDCLQNPVEWMKRGENCRQYVAEQHDVRREIDRLKNIIRHAVGL